ncbi:MAG: S46 family peptidase [Planctomycetota bacterium]|nr:MAG: S46 family peptidase [Planctomycetota bacterium]
MRRRAALVCSLLAAFGAAGAWLAADEGQWLPEQLPRLDWSELRQRGLELAPEQLWNGEEGLLSAAVSLEGCSAAFVSADGLIATNHHCGYGAINLNSTPERNLLRDGFTAEALADELPAPGTRVTVVRRIEDVTAQVQAAAEQAGTDPGRRWEAVQRKVRELVAEGEKEPSTSCLVTSFYEGKEWRRIFRTELRDVRLVYAPPESVGNYGGEVDNWMWPRHTADFCFLRAYAAPDGSPAAYSPSNVPYRPAHWLQVSGEGVDAGDLVMVLGYPGRTERYLTSVMLEAREAFFFPRRHDVYGRILAALREATAGDAAEALKVASRIRSLENRHKNADGMIWGLHRNQTVERRRAEEQEFRAWVDADPVRQRAYGGVLDALTDLDLSVIARQERDFVLDELRAQLQLFALALRLARLHLERMKPDLEREQGFQERDLARLRTEVENFGKSFALEADAAVFGVLLEEADRLPADQRIRGVDQWLKVYRQGGESHAALARRVLQQSPLAGAEARGQMLEEALRPDWTAAAVDPLGALSTLLLPEVEEQKQARYRVSGRRMEVGARWIQALEEWRGRRFYPDANGTLRVSIATVRGYVPQEGVRYDPPTTLSGMLAKHTGEPPFDLPESLRAAAAREDAGGIPVCFLADADTTGGNSGSPIVDGKGRLVGLNFDRVFENVAGDYGYSPERSRNIGVDVRFILWLLDRVQPAPRLLAELGIEKAPNTDREEDRPRSQGN